MQDRRHFLIEPVKKSLVSGSLTGLSVGFSWSVFEHLVTRDQLFDGREFALSLIIPFFMGLIVGRVSGVRYCVVLPIAYLTLAIPLFGIGMGGANVIQMTTGGAIGGTLWAVFFLICDQVIKLVRS